MPNATLEAQHVANIAWGLGRAGWHAPAFLRAVSSAVLSGCIPLASFQTIHLAQLAWALAKARDAGSSEPSFSSTPPKQQQQMHLRNSSNSSDADQDEDSPFADLQLLKRITHAVADRVRMMGPAELCMVAWALAVIRRPAPSLYRSIAVRACNLLKQGRLSQSNQATLLWAYARQGIFDEPLFDALCTAVLPSMHTCSTGTLSMVMWAMAATMSLGEGKGAAAVRRHVGLAKKASLVMHAELHNFSGSELSNLAWALAEVGHYEPQLWDAMAQHLLLPRPAGAHSTGAHLQQFGPEGHTTGFSTGEHPHSASMQHSQHQQHKGGPLAADAESVSRDDGGRGQSLGEPPLARMQAFELSKLVWAYAKVGHVDEQLFGEVSDLLCAAASNLPRRYSRAKRTAAAAGAAVRARMGSLAAAASTSAALSPAELDRLSSAGMQHNHLQTISSTFSSSSSGGAVSKSSKQPQVLHAGTVSRAMWAFAMLGLHDDPVLPALMPHVRAVLPHTEPRDVAGVLWALAASGLGSEDDDLVVACVTRASSNLRLYSLSQLADILWALATLQSQPGRTYGLLDLSRPIITHTKAELQHRLGAPARVLHRTLLGIRLEDVAAVTWSLMVLRHYDPDFLRTVARGTTVQLEATTNSTNTITISSSKSSSSKSSNSNANASSRTPAYAPSNSSSSSSSSSSSGTPVQSHPNVHTTTNNSPPTPPPSVSSPATTTQPDPEHLASLLYALAACSSYQPGLFHVSAQLLVDQLDMLGMEQLVQVAWAYASMLPYCLGTTRFLSDHSSSTTTITTTTSMGSSRGIERKHLPSAQSKGGGKSSAQSEQQGVSGVEGSSQLSGPELVGTHVHLLRAAEAMLSAAIPHTRRARLPPQELLLLWQAHELCSVTAPEVARVLALAPSHPSATGTEAAALVADQHEGVRAAFSLSGELCARAIQVSCMASQTRRKRQQAELAVALESCGFSTLPRVSNPAAAASADELALAMAGPDFVGAEQGHMKVAVILVVPGEHTMLTHVDKLLGEHRVKVDLLQRKGWLVVRLLLADWGQQRTQEERAAFLGSCLDRALSRRGMRRH